MGRRVQTSDVTTLSLVPEVDPPVTFRAGQFNMLTSFGIGEAAISVSGIPGPQGPLEHTVRDVGPVTHALCTAEVGDVVGVRGPFGTDWGTGEEGGVPEGSPRRHGRDVVVVAGGIGLAPLRGAVYELLARVDRGDGRSRRVVVLVGAREPDQIIFGDDLAAWARMGAQVEVTVDVAGAGWAGHVGLVTSLLRNAEFEPEGTTALVCGPEIMMRFTARALVDGGVDPDRIMISLERNMQCALAWCGHCQLGPLLVCRDGPIVSFGGVAADLLTQRER
ncbi:MAG TPA: FAD/NAD(P)-binding protein [Acidimicrobiales bacterium]|nr:FAD/NAD(P)-binding protein [Acidimicrobiales bacterium]